MLPSAGVLLTAEQSYRLSIIDNASRDQIIELIAAHLRSAQKAKHRIPSVSGLSLRESYQLPLGRDRL